MGLKNKTVYALAVNGTSLYAGTDGGGVFRSIDNAESWTEINTGLTRKTVKSFAFSGTTLFAGINNGGVFRTTDDGAPATVALCLAELSSSDIQCREGANAELVDFSPPPGDYLVRVAEQRNAGGE